MVGVVFHSGAMLTGENWRQVEDAIKDIAWNPDGRREFRREMALRARNWSGAAVSTHGSSRRFLAGLESAGILRLLRPDDEVIVSAIIETDENNEEDR